MCDEARQNPPMLAMDTVNALTYLNSVADRGRTPSAEDIDVIPWSILPATRGTRDQLRSQRL